jgi:hypothetical protein
VKLKNTRRFTIRLVENKKVQSKNSEPLPL